MSLDIPSTINKLKSGIVKITFYKNGTRVGSGSGFLCRGRLISNNHVFFGSNKEPLSGVIVGIRFGDMSLSQDDVLKIPYEQFMDKLESGSTEENFDYAIFNIESSVDFKTRYQFELEDNGEIREGFKILIMGYPFGESNITSHIGYVSSLYNNGKLDVIQLDASTNNGNSGGPVIDLETLKVVGIVTRKQTGLAEQFDELIKSFDTNLGALSRISGTMSLGGINIVDVFKVTQTQMKIISLNIKRSANSGIGYAYSCKELREEKFYALP